MAVSQSCCAFVIWVMIVACPSVFCFRIRFVVTPPTCNGLLCCQ